MAAVTSIVRAQQILFGRIDATLKPFALSFARYEILMVLTFSSRGSMPMSRLGSRLQVHPASVTSAVERLEGQGFVSREPDAEDRRKVLATITETGRAIALSATEALNEHVFTSVGISAGETTQLISVLEILRRSADDF
ncbi:MAG: MarR family transcriptional regulator [Actinobacteria bacterium]|nr:MarR family transcriptional regulator [Actinomycetota bacterium]